MRFAGKAVLDGVFAEHFANWNWVVFVRRWIGSLLVDNISDVVSPLQLRATKPEGAALPPLHLILDIIWSNVIVIRGRRRILSWPHFNRQIGKMIKQQMRGRKF